MKLGFVFLALFFLLPIASAADVSSIDAIISINDDRSADWTVIMKYQENVTRSDYFVLSEIRSVEVTASGKLVNCNIKEETIGTSILCSGIRSDTVAYRFTSPNAVTEINDFLLFNYKFTITQIIPKMEITSIIPIGAGIVEEQKLSGGLKPYTPASGIQGSDGRRISVTWLFTNPALGDSRDVSIIYEKISEQPAFQLIQLFVIVGLLAALGIIGFFFFRSRKHSIKTVLPILTEGERKLVQILIREKKEVDQRTIVKELDYSKSKVSRIISDLEKRGLVEKRPKGRTNLIKMKKTGQINVKKDEKQEKRAN